MTAYWDTSALLKLIFVEPGTDAAVRAQTQSRRIIAWDWTAVEACAATFRRGGPDEQKRLSLLLRPFQWIGLSRKFHNDVIGLAKKHHLRSADAGHLFCVLKARELAQDTVLVCFDEELSRAAASEGIPVFEQQFDWEKHLSQEKT